jgi:hypothetical protein
MVVLEVVHLQENVRHAEVTWLTIRRIIAEEVLVVQDPQSIWVLKIQVVRPQRLPNLPKMQPEFGIIHAQVVVPVEEVQQLNVLPAEQPWLIILLTTNQVSRLTRLIES